MAHVANALRGGMLVDARETKIRQARLVASAGGESERTRPCMETIHVAGRPHLCAPVAHADRSTP